LIDCRRAFGKLAAKQAIFEFTDLIDVDRLSSRLEMTGLIAIWRIKRLVLQKHPSPRRRVWPHQRRARAMTEEHFANLRSTFSWSVGKELERRLADMSDAKGRELAELDMLLASKRAELARIEEQIKEAQEKHRLLEASIQTLDDQLAAVGKRIDLSLAA
jgi:hypothetical protein